MTTSIITDITITKKGELKFFEVNIPGDAILAFDPQAVIKGSGLNDLIAIAGRNTAGLLKLQSENISDLYHSSVVTFGGSDVEPLLPGYSSVVPELLTLFYTPYYQNEFRPIPQLEGVESYVLYGCYQDLIGAMLNADVAYTVSLTLWTKLKTTGHDTGTGK